MYRYKYPTNYHGNGGSSGKPRFILFLIIIMVASFSYLGLVPSSSFGPGGNGGLVNRFGNISQDNQTLVKYLKEQVLVPPSNEPYDFSKVLPLINLENPSQYNQSTVVLDILRQINKIKNGFFVEYEALDGVFLSNTLYFERSFNWTGLLIEVHPDVFESLKTINRKAWIANTCLSTKTYPELLDLHLNPTKGIHSLIQNNYYHASKKTIKVQCFPLYSFLLALEKDTIDYFSLDVEGAELAILQTIPFDKVKFLVLEVEVDGDNNALQKAEIKLFMESKGYILYQYAFPDYIFIHESLKDNVTFPEMAGTGNLKAFNIGWGLAIAICIALLFF